MYSDRDWTDIERLLRGWPGRELDGGAYRWLLREFTASEVKRSLHAMVGSSRFRPSVTEIAKHVRGVRRADNGWASSSFPPRPGGLRDEWIRQNGLDRLPVSAVVSAARACFESGVRPTAARVRERLGQ